MPAVFRQKSLDRLKNPEDLDQNFKIVSPLNWVILAALGILLLVALIWSIFGSIATHVQGQGILISRDQMIYDAVADASGQIRSIEVRLGDTVEEGQVVALLRLPLLTLEVNKKQQQLDILEKQYQHMQTFVELSSAQETQHNALLRQNWQKDVDNLDQHIKYLHQAIQEREKLVGVAITNQQLADLKSQYYKELQTRDAIAHKITENQIESQRRREQDQEKLREMHNRVIQARHELLIAQRTLEIKKQVRSPVAGQVIEIIGKPGVFVNPGDIIIDVEGAAEEVDAAIYVPARQAQEIKSGMVVHVVPTSIRKEEYGSIVGTVKDITRFPSSHAGMMAVLGNEKLVQDFSRSGPQVFLRVDLTEANTPSGYKWTSSKGPAHLDVSNGTLCTADILVKTQAPITLVIPALKRLPGL